MTTPPRRAPLVAVCGAREQVTWGPWEIPADMLPASYAAALRRAGAIVLMVPPDPAVTADPDRILELVDGLLLAGGSDLDGASYGAASTDGAPGVCPDRDRSELALARRALERGLPVLGICRGMQLLNVACGGSLRTMEDATGHAQPNGTFVDHEVTLAPDSVAARVAGGEQVAIRSAHHQEVDRLGDGLVVSGRSADGRVIEAIERPGHELALGVLWHPEQDPESHVLAGFVTRLGVAKAAV